MVVLWLHGGAGHRMPWLQTGLQTGLHTCLRQHERRRCVAQSALAGAEAGIARALTTRALTTRALGHTCVYHTCFSPTYVL